MTARAEKQAESHRAEAIRVAQESVRNNLSSASGPEFSPVPKVGQREAFRLGLVLPARKKLQSVLVLNRSDGRDFAGHFEAETTALFLPNYAISVTDANSSEFRLGYLPSS